MNSPCCCCRSVLDQMLHTAWILPRIRCRSADALLILPRISGRSADPLLILPWISGRSADPPLILPRFSFRSADSLLILPKIGCRSADPLLILPRISSRSAEPLLILLLIRSSAKDVDPIKTSCFAAPASCSCPSKINQSIPNLCSRSELLQHYTSKCGYSAVEQLLFLCCCCSWLPVS